MIRVAVEPTGNEVVGKREDPRRANGVVGADVSHDGELGAERHPGEDKVAEERSEGTAGEPVAEWLEDELGAAIGVLFPSCKLVVAGQRDALLESIPKVATHAHNVTGGLQAKSHVKVLGDGRLGPELLLVVVGTLVGNLLERGPSQDGVVANEWCNITRGDGKLDLGVDHVGEEGDTVLEEAIGDVHNTGGILNDGDLRGVLHLGDGVDEAVGRNTRVGVDDEDVITHANVAVRPSAALVLGDDLVESVLVGIGFVLLCPFLVAGQQS